MSSPLATRWASKTIAHLIAVLSRFRDDCLRMEQRFARSIALVDPRYRKSARNLVHYLALRQHDIRPLQIQLASLGLSSLGRCEPNTLAGLNAVLGVLERLAGATAAPKTGSLMTKPPVDFVSGPVRLERHARRLLGPRPAHRATHIMVTMPPEAAHDAKLVEALLLSGMDIMRINGAHDDAAAWQSMVRHLNQAKRATGLRCKILVDLAGPKLRTGALETEPGVLKIKPDRDRRGAIVDPARVWLTPIGQAPPAAPRYAVLPIDGDLPSEVNRIVIHDFRRKKRGLKVESTVGSSLLCSSNRTIYVGYGSRLLFFNRVAFVIPG